MTDHDHTCIYCGAVCDCGAPEDSHCFGCLMCQPAYEPPMEFAPEQEEERVKPTLTKFPTCEESKKAGWTISLSFLSALRKQLDTEMSEESIENILLYAEKWLADAPKPEQTEPSAEPVNQEEDIILSLFDQFEQDDDNPYRLEHSKYAREKYIALRKKAGAADVLADRLAESDEFCPCGNTKDIPHHENSNHWLSWAIAEAKKEQR